MARSPGIDRETFLLYLRQSGLLTREEMADLSLRHADLDRGRPLARALVAEGLLTRFQAERLLIGQTSGFILGQYRILDLIGKGGMGRVYKAQHRTMNRAVAIKVLSSSLLRTPRAVELFRHEIHAVGQLQHPNIVAAYDANEIQGRYYLVLEFVDGPNLEELVRRQGPLTVGLACDAIVQAASGLQCAHLLGMVHRDIKPANILIQWHGLQGVDSPGLVKISDFGIARLATPTTAYQQFNAQPRTILTRENTVMGTPDYLSPEQSRDLHKADIRSDIYGLGCTLYFLLTGTVPYPGGNHLDKLIRHATDTPRPVNEFRTDVPEEVHAILDRMLARNPAHRFQTPIELADALRPFAVSGPTPWAKPRVPLQDLETLATPADDLLSSNDEVPAPRSDSDLSTLVPTVETERHETPLQVSRSCEIRLPILQPSKRTQKLLVVAGVVASVLLTLILAIAIALR